MDRVISIDVANNLFSIILSVLTIVGILIAFVAWFIRLESKVQYLEKDHVDYKAATAAKDEKMSEKIDSLQTGMNQLLVAIGELKGKIYQQ